MNQESQYCMDINSSQTDQQFDQGQLTFQTIIFLEFVKLNEKHIWKYQDPRIHKTLLRKTKMWEELPYQMSRSIRKLQ